MIAFLFGMVVAFLTGTADVGPGTEAEMLGVVTWPCDHETCFLVAWSDGLSVDFTSGP